MSTRTQGLCGLIDQEIRAQMPQHGKSRENFRNLLQYVRATSRMLDPKLLSHKGSPDRLRRLMRGLLRMSLKSFHFVRPIESWYCESSSHHDQVNSLLQHLFAKYPVPRFMNCVWFEEDDSWISRSSCSMPGVNAYLALGKGIGPRQCGLPVPLSKSVARRFMCAPDDLNVWQAIRWAQVLAAGGSPWLGRTILKTRLNSQQKDEPYWGEVIQFFCRAEKVDSPTLDEHDVTSIVEFVREQRFHPASRVLNFRFVGNDGPLQPNFSLRNRTLRWIRRHQVNWKNEIDLPRATSKEANRKHGAWGSMGLSTFREESGNGIWTIQELLTAHELSVEGGIMKHCVGEYKDFCLKNESSIWSMRVLRNNVCKRVMTIEVCPHRRIVLQANGKANSSPSEAAENVLARWAKLEKLGWSG